VAGPSAPDAAFDEDDFVMGVPEGPPLGLLAGIAAAVALVLGVAAYLLLG
jgi:hypothetical protein